MPTVVPQNAAWKPHPHPPLFARWWWATRFVASPTMSAKVKSATAS